MATIANQKVTMWVLGRHHWGQVNPIEREVSEVYPSLTERAHCSQEQSVVSIEV
jgi:hypothetical protein